MLAALLFLNAEAGLPSTCPGTQAWFTHGSAYFTVKFEKSCADVSAEIEARGTMEGGWHDPHNGGTYSVKSTNGDQSVELQRVTGSGTYTDKLTFAFQTDGSGCQVQACSESQVTSVYDNGTNFCNLWDLFCNSSNCNGSICCKPITANGDFTNYSIISGPTCNSSTNCPSTSSRASTCLLTTASSLSKARPSPSLERILKQKAAQ